MLQIVKRNLKKKLPKSVLYWVKPFAQYIKSIVFNIQFKRVQYNQRRALLRIKKKDKIVVVFFLIHDADWKYEGVYRLMEKDEQFEPIVVVCPYIAYGDDFMLRILNHAYNSFKKEGYRVIKSLNENTGKWLNIKSEIHPDIICFTSPWELTRPEYLIQNYLDTLTCYVPYGFKISHLYEAHFNKPTQNLVWKFFLETDIHLKLSQKYSRNNAANAVVTGYPGMDRLLQKDYHPSDVWKINDEKIKRIIWAPHHTIPGMGATLDYSTFLSYSDFMLEIADRNKEKIQIAFKPHPILRINLSKEEVWGKEKTDKYYQRWADLQNGQLIEGDYMDLFFTSDGMIHDSGSFLIEYLYTNKPVMFMFSDDLIPERFNEIGKIALSKLYNGKNKTDIEEFIEDIIIKGNDYLKSERIEFFNTIIKPPNNNTASENIFNYLKSVIFNKDS
jgi:hypothetical protein